MLVEVKKVSERDVNWAEQFRDNLKQAGWLPQGVPFLLVLPRKLFFWNGESLDAAPTVLDGTEALNPYFGELGMAPDKVHGETFELLVGTLLEKLARGEGPALLQESPVGEALLGNTIQRQVAY